MNTALYLLMLQHITAKLPVVKQHDSSLIKCIDTLIVQNQVKHVMLMTNLVGEPNQHFPANFLPATNYSVVVREMDAGEERLNLKQLPIVDLYLAYFEQTPKLTEYIIAVRNLLYWFNEKKFAFFTTQALNASVAEMILKTLRKDDIFNGVAISQCALYSMEHSCNASFLKMETMDKFSFENMSNLLQCPLNVRVRNFEGFALLKNRTWAHEIPPTDLWRFGPEIYILASVASKLKVKLLFYHSTVSFSYEYMQMYLYDNGTLRPNTDMVKLFDSVDDMSIGYYRIVQFLNQFQLINYMEESEWFCVPNILVDCQLEQLRKLVPINTLLLTILVYLACSLLLWVKRGPESLLVCYQLLLGLASHWLPRTVYTRFVAGLLIVFSLVFVTTYQTLMISVLSTTCKSKPIQTLDDVIKHNLRIIGSVGRRNFFEMNIYPKSKEILQNFVQCNVKISCIYDAAKSQDSAFLMTDYERSLFAETIRKPNSDELAFYCLKDKFSMNILSMIVRRNLLLFERIRREIDWFFCTGHLEHWKKIFALNYKKDQNLTTSLNISSSNSNRPFSLDDLNVFFILWGCGIGLAVLVLLIELFA